MAADPDDLIAELCGEVAPPPSSLGEDSLVSAETLADWLGLTPNRVHALAREGALPRGDRKRFPLKASVQSYAAFVRENPRGRPVANASLAAEKERLTRAQADRAELQAAKARGELVPVAEVETAWASILRDLRAGMLAIPVRVQQRLGHLTTTDVAAIDREVRDALEEASHGAR
ncbi:MAG: hypothetical protein ACFBWO_00285 [Paracoccaceae bacterium]